jgi:hypothetical protein
MAYMKYKLTFILVFVILVPVIFFAGYDLGSFHERGLDAPGKAVLITLAVSSYEENDVLAHQQLLSYIDTELSLYDEYLDHGIPLIAVLTDHNYHLEVNDGYLQYINDFIEASNNDSIRHKDNIIDTLKRIKQKSHNKSSNLTGAKDAPPS